MSMIRSRSRKQYQNMETAPRSRAEVPSQTRCEWIRLSSMWITRRYFARSGISRPTSRSTQPQKASMLKK
jgi:hypothetical protein